MTNSWYCEAKKFILRIGFLSLTAGNVFIRLVDCVFLEIYSVMMRIIFFNLYTSLRFHFSYIFWSLMRWDAKIKILHKIISDSFTSIIIAINQDQLLYQSDQPPDAIPFHTGQPNRHENWPLCPFWSFYFLLIFLLVNVVKW